MIDTSVIRARFTAVERDLNERSRRLLAEAKAKAAGFGGITATSLATGMARNTIGRGLKDLAAPASLSGEVRRPGGGGPTLIDKDPTLLESLRRLVEPATMGDPMRPLLWVSKSHAKLAARSAWRLLSAGAGTKRARLHDWAYCELADLDAAEYDSTRTGTWTRGLLIRRTIADGDMAFFSTWCPAGTAIRALVKVEGHRWAIEDSFETAKNELGLDHNETRSWHGWHRHVSLVMLAFAMLAAIRHHANGQTANASPPPKKQRRAPSTRRP